MPTKTVHQWFIRPPGTPDITKRGAWRATELAISKIPGAEKIPNTAQDLDALLIDERGYVRAEHEKAQGKLHPSTR
jgi:hypothetical protein